MSRVKFRVSIAVFAVMIFASSASAGLGDLIWGTTKSIAKELAWSIAKDIAVETWDNFTSTNEQLLFKYSARGNASGVRSCISKGVDVNMQDREGRTAIFYAAYSGSLATVQVLIDAGTDVRIEDKLGKRARDYTDKPEIIDALDSARTCCGKIKDNKWWVIGIIVVLFLMIVGAGAKK